MKAKAALAHARALEKRELLLVDALKDARSGLRYVRQAHGELYGVGFDRVEEKCDAALAAFLAANAPAPGGRDE